ncbi:MAG TPA: DUF4838 domain-containing protein [Verrucomicrobiota bacterium]|nr:DUF4838 domain-containing protein [Verrucomicrobiota bacterium]
MSRRFRGRVPAGMKSGGLTWLLCAIAAMGSSSGRQAGAAAFELTRDGKPACVIVTAPRPTPAARLAALELQSHVLKITGAEIPIRSDGDPGPGGGSAERRILVGESEPTRALGFRSRDFKTQEYGIVFRPDTVVLIGRDWEDTEANRNVAGRPMVGASMADLRHRIDYWKAVGMPERSAGDIELPGLYDDQGSCLAAYDFLERFCGVRWYGPAGVGLVVPSRGSLAVEGQAVRRTPALAHRSALHAGNWPFLRTQWGKFTQDQVRLHWRRMRQGGVPWAANHTFHRSTIKEVFNDPEYQSKNPKSAGSQLCYTHPKLIQQVAQRARDFFDGKGGLPEGWKAAGDYFAIVPDDNMNLCTCPSCAALLKDRGPMRTGFFSSGEMSDYWFTFVNAVAREVRRTHPDRYIATLAYWAYAVPPSFPVEPNVSVAPCLHTCYYPVHPEMKENDFRFYQGWKQKTPAPMFLWVYYHHPMEPALINQWHCFPHVMVHETAKAMQGFIRDGVRGIFECGEQDQLEQYVMVKVWDDPETSVDGLIDEFFRLYFGAAGDPMKRFYLGMETIACDRANYPPPYARRDGIDWKRVAWERLGTAERMEAMGSLMTQAEQRAATDLEKQRVALWRRAFWEWMQQGRAQAGQSPSEAAK